MGDNFSLSNCIYWCRDHDYAYAALQDGSKCYCDGLFGHDVKFASEEEVGQGKCVTACDGQGAAPDTICGGGHIYNSIWSTNGLKYGEV